MQKTFQAVVFGKAGCDKCQVLRRRLEAVLAEPEWADFEQAYFDVDTVEGLVEFCRMECLNPQRLPALVVRRLTPAEPVPVEVDPARVADPILGTARLYHLAGLQTDYGPAGRGVVTREMIRSALAMARAAAAP